MHGRPTNGGRFAAPLRSVSITTPHEGARAVKIFRSHTSLPDGLTSSLYRQLIQEWVELHHSPSTTRTVQRWARREPVLKGCRTPGEIVDRIDLAPHVEKDELLLALVRLAQDGHQLAGRTVLQALLPKLSRIASRTSQSSTGTWAEDHKHITIAEFWQVLAEYPVERRPRRVAANLGLDTLHRICRAGKRPEPVPVDPHDHLTPEDQFTAGHARYTYLSAKGDQADIGSGLELSVDSDLPQLLAWALQQRLLTEDEAQLLTTVYLHAEKPGAGYAAEADAQGVSQAALRQRCSRAVRRLTVAVRTELIAGDEVVAAPSRGAA